MESLPTLFKKTSTGAIQYWTIWVNEFPIFNDSEEIIEIHGQICTEYGQVGTSSPQFTSDFITKGKNTGKKNETTALQQAESEAKAKHTKQKKKGYVESLEAAQNEEVDEIIEGGTEPMLAHKFRDHAHKIKYPCYCQPKLDGIRCIAILKNGKCTLWTRTRKPITSVPHIIKAIEESFKEDIVLDGELYNHLLKKDFEQIVSKVRQKEPAEGHEIVQYHIYDIVNNEIFKHRLLDLCKVPAKHPLFYVQTFEILEEEMMEFFDRFINNGYEGLMLRNSNGLYANKRSYDLQKVKEFDTDEFEILDVKEGRGKMAGYAIFICKLNNEKTVSAKLKGDTKLLKEYFENDSLWKGKKLTIQYQGFTSDGSLRFPVGIAVRDYE